jgi:hypothetical protein
MLAVNDIDLDKISKNLQQMKLQTEKSITLLLVSR